MAKSGGKVAYYAFLDRCGLEIEGLSHFSLPDLNEKFRSFKADSLPASRIKIKIGPFVPDLAGTTNVDHQYFIRRSYLYFQESLPGMDFSAEIQGLEEEVTEVRFHLTRKSRLSAANLLYPDAALHAYVLQPLLECKLSGQGLFLMHAGGVAKDGRASLFVGRGGSFKTTYCYRHVQKGFEFLGDDLVMFDREKVYPFPIHAAYFDYHIRQGLNSESDLVGARKIAAIFHLYNPPAPSFKLSGPAVPTEVTVIHPREEWAAPTLRPISLSLAVDKINRNNRMERSSSVPSKYQVGNFLNAYGLIFPDNVYSGIQAQSLACLERLLAGSKARLLETDSRWHEENLAALAAKLLD